MIVSQLDGLEAYISSHHQLCRSCRGKRRLEQSEPSQPRVLTGERYAVSDYPYFPAFPSLTADPHSLTNGSCQKYGYNEWIGCADWDYLSGAIILSCYACTSFFSGHISGQWYHFMTEFCLIFYSLAIIERCAILCVLCYSYFVFKPSRFWGQICLRHKFNKTEPDVLFLFTPQKLIQEQQ